MNKKLLRGIALALACVLLLLTVSCSGGNGKTLMTLKKGQTLTSVQVDVEDSKGYKKTKIPATGVPLVGEQLRID